MYSGNDNGTNRVALVLDKKKYTSKTKTHIITEVSIRLHATRRARNIIQVYSKICVCAPTSVRTDEEVKICDNNNLQNTKDKISREVENVHGCKVMGTGHRECGNIGILELTTEAKERTFLLPSVRLMTCSFRTHCFKSHADEDAHGFH